jgi:predicted nucleic acid-binding Zn ribbon protein
MKRRNERTMQEAIDGLVDAYGLREKLDEQAVASLWDELAGGMVAKHTVAVKLRKGKLFIKVDSAPLRQELTFMREGLKATINGRLGRPVVEEIRLD